MANHKSAKKRIKQNEKRRVRNRTLRSRLRGTIKLGRTAIAEGGASGTSGPVQAAVSELAKAKTRGILHRKTVARRISRLMKAANKS